MEIKDKLGLAEKIHDRSTEKQREITDKLAVMVKADFDAAVRHRNGHKFGDKTATEILQECYDQYYGVVSCEIAKAFPGMPNVNLTQLKVSALNAWIRDLLFGSGGTPFTVEPTPVPELNEEMENEILDRVKDVLFGDELFVPKTPAEMKQLVKKEKDFVREARVATAKRACELMETEMWDQCVDGGYMPAFLKFLQDFCIYPYAVLEGPVPEVRTQHYWSGNSLKERDEVVYAVNHVSPHDFFWSADSTSAQDGSYVIIRKRYSRQSLIKMAKMKSYLQANVTAALEHFSDTRTNMDWLNTNPEQQNGIIWDGKAPLEVLKYYGAVLGSTLAEYGITGLNDMEYYECIIHTLGPFTLKVVINPNPNANLRPVYVTSYEKSNSGILGFGISQKIRDVEKSFQACMRGMIKNMEYSSGPIGEVDFARIQQWINDDQVGEIAPYTVNLVDGDPTGGGRSAYVFHNIPNNSGALSNVCQWFMSLADIVTQIPASIHGQPVGTGANRTFRGMSMLYGNALKGVQSSITNVDTDVVTPFATSLYMLNLKYNPKDEIKGDAKVIARGSTGLMEKELKKNDMLEAAQIVASLAQTGQVKPETLDRAVGRVLEALDLVDTDIDDVASHFMPEEQPMQQDSMAMMAQGGPPQLPQGEPPQQEQAQAMAQAQQANT